MPHAPATERLHASWNANRQEYHISTAAECPLSDAQQRRNAALYGVLVGTYSYLPPVLYVGLLHAALLNRLHASKLTANMPASLCQYSIAFAVIIAWAFPQPRLLRRLLLGSILVVGLASFAVGAVIALTPDATNVIIGAVIAHGALLGMANGVANTLMWESLNRGMAPGLRGAALSLAFGVGPLLAVTASLLTQLVLNPEQRYDFTIPLLGWQVPLGRLGIPTVAFPMNFAVLFAVTLPCMVIPFLTTFFYCLPPPGPDPVRPPFLQGVFGGIGEYFRHPLIRRLVIAYLLVYSGLLVMGNVSLYTPFAMGAQPDEYVGIQQALRFGFKAITGLLLGWIVVRFSPRASLFVTTGLLITGVIWGMTVTGSAFLLAFGFLGAGELMGAYYPNYVFCCSPALIVRRNMAITNMITLTVGIAPMIFGALADAVRRATASEQSGLQASFVFALALLFAGVLIVLVTLPARPAPRE